MAFNHDSEVNTDHNPTENANEYYINKYTWAIIRKIPIILLTVALIGSTFVSYSLFRDKSKLEIKVATSFAAMEKEVNKLQAGISQNDTRRWNIMGVQKWIKQINSKLSTETCYSYATIIVDEAERQKVDVALITSIARQESYYVFDKISPAGAIGLMQIMPEIGMWIAKEIGVSYSDEMLKQPEMNIRFGTWFLAYLMQKYDNNEALVTAHYNGGNKQRNKYTQRQKHKHTKEYKLSVTELRDKLELIKDELILAGKTEDQFREDVNYKYIADVYDGKTMSKETEKYIPEVLTRAKKIRNFLAKSSES